MDEFQMIKSTLMSIKEYVSMISSFPNESDRNSVIRQFNIQFIFNKYIQEVAKELHIKLEGLHKVNSATSEADAYYIYL